MGAATLGNGARLVACRMVAFMVLLYVIYAASLLIDGVGLGSGLFPGEGPSRSPILPAIVAARPVRDRRCDGAAAG